MDVPESHAGEAEVAPRHPVIEVVDPADRRRVVGAVPACTADEARAAAKHARAALEPWQGQGPVARSRVLGDAASLLRSRVGELASLIRDECGKTIAESHGEAEKAADFFDYYAAMGRLPQGEVLADARRGARAWTIAEPVGVVLAVTPFNDPLITPARKLGPALIAGNSVLLKPAPATPLIACRLREVLQEAGLPDGVLTVLTGAPEEVVQPLLSGRLVDALTFTGSTAVGRELERAAAGTGVRVQCELGGKNTSVVMPDAALQVAAGHIVASAFGQSGQRCTATSRVLVHRDVAGRLLELLQDQVGMLVQGRGDGMGVTLGPMIDSRALAAAHRAVQESVALGARVVTGGEPAEHGDLEHGSFFQPTVITEVPAAAPVWCQELFAPVLAIRIFETMAEAIAIVNDTDYGLAAALFSQSVADVELFTREVSAGQIAVNLPTTGWDAHLPFGGFKASGSPFKEQGREGLRFYQRIKTVALAP